MDLFIFFALHAYVCLCVLDFKCFSFDTGVTEVDTLQIRSDLVIRNGAISESLTATVLHFPLLTM